MIEILWTNTTEYSPDKLRVPQLMKFSIFSGVNRFVTKFTRANKWKMNPINIPPHIFKIPFIAIQYLYFCRYKIFHSASAVSTFCIVCDYCVLKEMQSVYMHECSAMKWLTQQKCQLVETDC